MYDVAIVGGGIVGLSTALALGRKDPNVRLVVLEKEGSWAAHQTGNNSGVIHSGIYYKPGSQKAKLCRKGNQSMAAFCEKHQIAYEICGKLIVATDVNELPLLGKIGERGQLNGVHCIPLTPDKVKEIEPHVHCLGGLLVRSTGIVDYREVCRKYVELIEAQGGELCLNTKVLRIQDTHQGQVIETSQGEFEASLVVNCAGLHSDRIARMGQVNLNAKIIPFRGEYYELKPEKRYLVKNLIYPVPNPNFPFLGVHFTRMIDGTVHAGPNAVLSLKREGYRKTDFSFRDFAEIVAFPGLWKLAARHANEGMQEIIRSFSKAAFVSSLQRLIPEIQPDDVVPTHAGVRAQALKSSGELVDDFLILQDRKTVHVCNAPSPAATSSIEIGKEIAERVGAIQ